MQAEDPNRAEQVTAVAATIGALGLLGGIGAAIFAGRQAREARKSRDALIAAEFFWPPSSFGAKLERRRPDRNQTAG
jgi:hypothetical protein